MPKISLTSKTTFLMVSPTKRKFLLKSNKVQERAAQGVNFLWALLQRERGERG